MEEIYYKIFQTGVIVIVLWIIRYLTVKQVIRRLIEAQFHPARKRISVKIFNFIFFWIAVILLAGVWGLRGTQILAYITSILTILGVAFFAQWSLLCNITSGLILFFNHPLMIGDAIVILDKDFPIEGTIEDISFFFLHIRDKEGKLHTIPNVVVMQKTIRIVEHPAAESKPA